MEASSCAAIAFEFASTDSRSRLMPTVSTAQGAVQLLKARSPEGVGSV